MAIIPYDIIISGDFNFNVNYMSGLYNESNSFIVGAPYMCNLCLRSNKVKPFDDHLAVKCVIKEFMADKFSNLFMKKTTVIRNYVISLSQWIQIFCLMEKMFNMFRPKFWGWGKGDNHQVPEELVWIGSTAHLGFLINKWINFCNW